MFRTPGKTSTLIVALLLALYAVPAVGYGPTADQPLNRGADAARYAPAILGTSAGAADLVERPQCPGGQTVQLALLPEAVLFGTSRPGLRSVRDEGSGLAASALAGTIPIRAPPTLPSSANIPG